ncbi:hypothetical protein N9B94_00695 [Verrucomicrobia bacterium]|nr:hypothetical protein [Verrucomicrobiota bacterium]
MKKPYIVIGVIILVVIPIVLLKLMSVEPREMKDSDVIVLYQGTDEAGSSTFLVTNATDRTVMVDFHAIEVKQETGWTNYSGNQRFKSSWVHLAPYSEAEKTFTFVPALPDQKWRMRMVAGEKLEG